MVPYCRDEAGARAGPWRAYSDSNLSGRSTASHATSAKAAVTFPPEERKHSEMTTPLDRINSILCHSTGFGRILMSQQLIDDAFPTDELADAWFKARGLRLTPVRLQGRPGLASIYCERQTLQHLKRKRKTVDRPRFNTAKASEAS